MLLQFVNAHDQKCDNFSHILLKAKSHLLEIHSHLHTLLWLVLFEKQSIVCYLILTERSDMLILYLTCFILLLLRVHRTCPLYILSIGKRSVNKKWHSHGGKNNYSVRTIHYRKCYQKPYNFRSFILIFVLNSGKNIKSYCEKRLWLHGRYARQGRLNMTLGRWIELAPGSDVTLWDIECDSWCHRVISNRWLLHFTQKN